MASTVTTLQPTADTLVSPAGRSIVVEVAEVGTNPARELTVNVNAVNVLTWVGGSTTYLSGQYTLSVTAPATDTRTFTLTRTTNWPDPSTVAITARYKPTGALPGVVAPTVTVLAATFDLVASDPVEGNPDTRLDTPITFTANTTATIGDGYLLIYGVKALYFQKDPTWNNPDFEGSFVIEGGRISVNVNPRRVFDPDVQVDVDFTVDLSNGLFSVTHTRTYAFFTRQRRSPKPLTQGRLSLDTPLYGSPAAEALRYALLGALRTRALSPTAEVILYARVLRSSLKAARNLLLRPDLDAATAKIVPEDYAEAGPVDEVLEKLSILWLPALQDARNAGVDPLLLELIARSHDSPYPQDRLGALAFLLLAMASVA